MNYKIRKSMKPCPNPYYINVGWFHLPKPQSKQLGDTVETLKELPIIGVSINE